MHGGMWFVGQALALELARVGVRSSYVTLASGSVNFGSLAVMQSGGTTFWHHEKHREDVGLARVP